MTDTPDSTPDPHPDATPEGYDVQGSKRELLRQGRLRGFVTEEEIAEAMPAGMVTPTELEVFLFTLDMMEIQLHLAPGTPDDRKALLLRLSRGMQDDGTMDGMGSE